MKDSGNEISTQDLIDKTREMRKKIEKWDNNFIDADFKQFRLNRWDEFAYELEEISRCITNILRRPSPENGEEFSKFLKKLGD